MKIMRAIFIPILLAFPYASYAGDRLCDLILNKSDKDRCNCAVENGGYAFRHAKDGVAWTTPESSYGVVHACMLRRGHKG